MDAALASFELLASDLFKTDPNDLANDSANDFDYSLEDYNQTIDGEDQRSERLIAEVQKFPCLYDRTDPQYTDASSKSTLWDLVASSSGYADGRIASQRWLYLRGNYGKVLKKVKDGEETNWRYYKPLSFLEKHMKPHVRRSGSTTIPRAALPGLRLFTESLPVKRSGDLNTTLNGGTLSQQSTSSGGTPPSSAPLQRIRTPERTSPPPPKVSRTVETSAASESEAQLIGKIVVRALERMEPRKQKLAGIRIQEVLFNIEFGDA